MRQPTKAILIAAVMVLGVVWVIPAIANVIIDYQWWREIGQVDTWIGMLWYSIAPVGIGAVVTAAALWVAHARAMHFAGVQRRDHPLYSWVMRVALAIVAIILASASVDYWTVMRYLGSRGSAGARGGWIDPVFSRPLSFYLFGLPFYSQVLGFVFVLAILCALTFWATARGWQLIESFQQQRQHVRFRSSATFALEPRTLLLPGAGRTHFLRVVATILLLGLAALFWLGNYDLLYNSHPFMTGADFVDERITLPLRWALIVVTLAAIALVWTSRYLKTVYLVGAFYLLQVVVSVAVRIVYVRPNEISIERPYIQRHIGVTISAFGLDRNTTERPFVSSGKQTTDATQDAALLDNIRLWDLRAYNATISQIQALRPYYTFPDTDVDRYFINGHIKQVLLSAREIDVTQLSAEASQS